jgi:hypothetical protein
MFTQNQPFRVLSVGMLETLVYSAPIENGETLHQHSSHACQKPFATTQGPLEVCDSPWLDVSMCELIQVEDILSIYCEFWINKQ